MTGPGRVIKAQFPHLNQVKILMYLPKCDPSVTKEGKRGSGETGFKQEQFLLQKRKRTSVTERAPLGEGGLKWNALQDHQVRQKKDDAEV